MISKQRTYVMFTNTVKMDFYVSWIYISFLQIYRRLLSPFTVHAEICHYKNIL